MLNKEQSLKYQIMKILMEEHKRARLGLDHIGFYDGDDYLILDDWDTLRNKIISNVTDNYKETFSLKSKDEFLGFMDGMSENYVIKELNGENETYFEFTITPQGYRYQFNGYMQSEDKRNLQNAKLTKKANFFIGMTLIYYIVTFIIKDLDYDINKDIEMIISLIKIHDRNILIITSKIIITFILNIVLIKFIANYLENKIDNI